MNVIIENTEYSVLLYLLIENLSQNDIFLFTNELSICKKLKKESYYILNYGNFTYSKKKNKIFLLQILSYYYEILKSYLTILKIKFKLSKDDIIYGNDDLYISRFFVNNIFYLLEDGCLNYYKIPFKKNKLKDLIKLTHFKYESYGIEEKVKKIYLTGLAPIPKEIAHKVELINLKELWDKKTLEEQNEILDIFSFDLDIKEKIKGRDIILFTQPLSEDNVITEEEKLKIYSEIIKKYQKDRLVIKTHPREKTNYKDMFKEYLVLDNPFPFEILNLLDVKFNKAITLFSTAALGLGEGVEVDFYGTEVHDKILERFGSCDNIMKRNCFLEED